jgi:serine/threonine-protein kinase RsbW
MVAKNHLYVSGHYKNLSKISEFIGQAAVVAGLNERAKYAIQMAVDEACTNIIDHGYGGEGLGSIHLTYNIQEDGLQVNIYDHGKSFDPSKVPKLNTQAPLSERKPGGMGLYFIHHLADTVEFEFGTSKGNRLTLYKRRELTS